MGGSGGGLGVCGHGGVTGKSFSSIRDLEGLETTLVMETKPLANLGVKEKSWAEVEVA